MKITIMNHYINRDKKGFSAFVNKCIGFFTQSDCWHNSIILDGMRYESGMPYGATKTTRIPNHPLVDTVDIEVTAEQLKLMIAYAELQLKHNLPYNKGKLLTLAICWPTRFIWNKVEWVPFQNNYFGMVCSVFVYEILLAGGIELFPSYYKELIPPKLFAEYGSN